MNELVSVVVGIRKCQALRNAVVGNLQTRGLRVRLLPSRVPGTSYRVENPIVASKWPPIKQISETPPFSKIRAQEILNHVQQFEMERLTKLRSFIMPEIAPGDLVEVQYELSRTQQTQATFQGYCVEVRKRNLDSAIVLKNTYDGVGVTQLIPLYSPRLLSVRVVRKAPNTISVTKAPLTFDYRYRWHNFVRHKHLPPTVTYLHGPGIKSLEPRIQRRLSRIRKRYLLRRIQAGLPGYTYAGKTMIRSEDRSIEVRAEIHRRAILYTRDITRRLKAKQRRKRAKARWGVYQITKPGTPSPALSALPFYHPLVAGNLPS